MTISHKQSNAREDWILWSFYSCDKNSTDPVIPISLAYPSNNASNIFLLFGGTYNATSISPSLLIHAPSMNFGFGDMINRTRGHGTRPVLK